MNELSDLTSTNRRGAHCAPANEPELPIRKRNRIQDFDYSQNGGYFLTICLQNHMRLLWKQDYLDVNIFDVNFETILSKYGNIVNTAIKNIPVRYPSIILDKYVIMPNHIHLILIIQNYEGGSAMRSPTVSTVVNQMKGYVTKQIGFSPWQRSFHDHVIRGKEDYEKIWEYIDTNPMEWLDDDLYLYKEATP